MELKSPADLREHYAPAIERARLKVLRRLDAHCRQFIELSPFFCLGTSGSGGADVSPRGDRPGFVHVLDDVTLAIPDWPGNNRLDTLENIVENAQVGLLFLIPGVEESLRVNGTAAITMQPELLGRWSVDDKQPRSVMLVTVQEAFVHCGKALIRSRLWKPDALVDRSALPSYGRILKDQIETCDTAEQMEVAIAEAYVKKLY